MAGPQTLFDVLGVSQKAGEREIKDAWQRHFLQADASHDRVPQDIKDAYLFLQSDQNRTWYREIVRTCRKEYNIKLEPGEQQRFMRLCQLSQVQVFADPKMPLTYQLRLLGQRPPTWSTQPAAPVQLTTWQKVLRAIRRVVLFEVFRGKRAGQQLGLALVYIAVIFSVHRAGRWSMHTIAERRAQVLESAIKAGHAKAAALLSELKDKEYAMLADFEKVAGVKLDPASGQYSAPSHEVDKVLRAGPTVREAWAAVLNARIPADKWRAVTDSEAEIENRLKLKTFQPADRMQLDEITSWAQAAISSVEAQDANVKHIRSMLDAAKWHINQSERSTP